MSIEQKYTNLLFASLVERIQDFVSSAVHWEAEDTLKFRSLMLIVETKSLATELSKGRASRLEDYFENIPLRDCLECIRTIDNQKKEIRRRLFTIFCSSDIYDIDADITNSNHSNYTHEGRNEKQSIDPIFFPDIKASQLWNSNKPIKMGQAFYRTYENLDSRPEDDIETSIEENSLKKYQISNLDEYLLKESKGFNIFEYMNRIREVISDLTKQQIYNELMRSLEQLRVVFMEQAHDIFCVRTGDFSVISFTENRVNLDLCYSEIPLSKYYEERDERRKDVACELTQEIFDEWRFRNHITNRELCNEEYIRFLTERKEVIVQKMQSDFGELWKLREHSGGFNVDVNSENFARTFYARKGIDRKFFELQWEYEYLDELITAKENENAPDEKIEQWSPEDLAIKTFVEKQTKLVCECYKLYNGKRFSLSGNQGEVLVEIKKDELISYFKEQVSNNEKPLKQFCYPTTSKSKRQFCFFVVQLLKSNYYGKLPKKELAAILAPIVGLSPGATKNYLSQV